MVILIFFIIPFITTFRVNGEDDDELWDINFSCKPFIKSLAAKHAELVRCAVENNKHFSLGPQNQTTAVSLPSPTFYLSPRHKEQHFQSLHLLNTTSLDNRTCTTVIYNSYRVSYAQQLNIALSENIWEASNCHDCLHVDWDFEHGNSTFRFDNKTLQFKTLLWGWRNCVANESGGRICQGCQNEYDTLFAFYWRIYTDPSTFFCIDVDSEMNDTMKLWQVVLGCSDAPIDRTEDTTVLLFSVTVLAIVLGFFYAGSYIQSEQTHSNLIHYSRMQEAQPIAARSRILSSSTLDSSNLYSTPTSSLHL